MIGGGGREHALVWKLAQSEQVTSLWAAPGNAGMAGERLRRNGELVRTVDIGAEDLSGLLAFALQEKVDFTVVGPDNPLALGVVDQFQAKGLRIWGPNQQAARFEASKAYAQEFMERHGIPTARAGTFTDVAAALDFVATLSGRCAVKADGLALGKGVLICTDLKQARAAVESMLIGGAFGTAGRQVVIQELLEGQEVSLHALCSGNSYQLFPTAQDHKRALDGNQGLNTGGMGTVSPAPFLGAVQLEEAAREVLEPWLRGCRAEGIDFRGIIYPGLMLTQEGPKVLEFNARFGDPETQVYLMRLKSDLFELLWASAEGKQVQAQWEPGTAVCVVMAAAGYPGSYEKGKVITGLDQVEAQPGVKVFHAGTRRAGKTLVTHGGRVLGVTALGADLAQARDLAYEAAAKITFDGAQYRRDIGGRSLAGDRHQA